MPTVHNHHLAGYDDFATAFEPVPVFVILGVQGSGTNLLRRILAKTFGFAVIQDQSIIFNAARALGGAASPDAIQRQFSFVYSRLYPSSYVRRTSRRIKSNTSFDHIEDAFRARDLRSGMDLARFVYGYGAYRRGTLNVAIKSDDLWQSIGSMDDVLPNRRIILLTRDFRDNLVSITRKNFGPIDPLVAACYVRDRFAKYDAEFRRTEERWRLHVRYEELLADPDAFVRRFRERFELEGGSGRVPPPVDTSKIRRGNSQKFGALGERTLQMCEAILEDDLRNYGYPLATSPREPTTLEMYTALGRDALMRIPQKLRLVTNRLTR